MTAFARVILLFAAALIDAELLLLLVRAVMSWVMPDPSSSLWRVILAFTEPVIAPIRSVLNRFSFVRECPLDLSYLVTCILLTVISRIIGF